MLNAIKNAMHQRLWKWRNKGKWTANTGEVPPYITRYSYVQVRYEDGTRHDECGKGTQFWTLQSYWELHENDACNIKEYRVVKY